MQKKVRAKANSQKSEYKTVFIVDDDILALKVLEKMVQSCGFIVFGTCTTGRALIDKISVTQCDILLLDYHLQDMLVTEVIAELRKFSEIPILIISAELSEKLCRETLRHGAQGFISKIDALTNLRKAITCVLDGGCFVSENMRKELGEDFFDSLESISTRVLSARESEVYMLLKSGHSYQEIADKLGIKLQTVYSYKNRILEKFNARNLAELIVKMNQ